MKERAQLEVFHENLHFTSDEEPNFSQSSEFLVTDDGEHTDDDRISHFVDDVIDDMYDDSKAECDDPENYIEREECSVNISDSPNGTRYWIPKVPLKFTPVEGSVFTSFKEAQAMYERYAEMAGFDTRLSTLKKVKGEIRHRYILCNKAGKAISRSKKTVDDEDGGSSRRSTSSSLTDCKACVRFKAIRGSGSYIMHKFVDFHNHRLMEKEDMEYSKVRRKLQYPEKRFINKISTANIGPCTAYRLRSLCSGGRRRVRGNANDFRNYKRDLRVYIGKRDAQMLVDRLEKRKKNDPNFYFNYKCNERELFTLFWADDVAKINYKAFGDVLVFDATYRTNRYKMVFVPFTGVDHHKRSVTFGGALIKRETTECYKFILESFMEAHATQPKIVFTDQDLAVQAAVEAIFFESAHHLCMWHIMDKLPIKFTGDLLINTDLRKRINKLVWNTYLTPDQFEEQWKEMIQDFSLAEHKWLHDVFQIRDRWIPAYFRDLPMCCLLKTTSRSESVNAFFRRYMHPDNSLLEFMICFETAMDDQRYKQRKLDIEDHTKTPFMKTELPIERYVADVYTSQIFKDVQKQIFKGVWFCGQKSLTTDGPCDEYIITEKNRAFNVVINHEEKNMQCSCIKFERIGYLCSHIFCVLKFVGVNVIPDEYVLRRWRKGALPHDIYKKQQKCVTENDVKDELFQNAVSIVESCVSRLRGDTGKMKLFVDKLEMMRNEIFTEIPNEPDVNSNHQIFKTYLDVSSPEKVQVTVPEGARNKGCGTNKRMVGPGEKVVAKIKKKYPRLCRMCNKYEFHDSRTCDLNPKNLNRKAKLKGKQKITISSQSEEST
ncbi:hypothetical protein SSX86_020001 [Deinandra increscens subsp. villosa]|uniref:SWIM-type domain-containing protein n=1 Tax=Deinandra increscens subsp. villosa TaxID=3103831 RepID=A0AAP0CVC4_9ASTR